MRMLWRWPRERLIFTPAPSEVSSAGIICFRARCVMVSSSRLAMVPLNRGDGQDENAEFWREGSKKLKERPVARPGHRQGRITRSEEHTSELQSRPHLVCRLLLEKKKRKKDEDEG